MTNDERKADKFRDWVLKRTGLEASDLQCPREQSAMTPCVARDGCQCGLDAALSPRDKDAVSLIRAFDPALRAGDWCSCAYVCRDGSQQDVAIPVVA